MALNFFKNILSSNFALPLEHMLNIHHYDPQSISQSAPQPSPLATPFSAPPPLPAPSQTSAPPLAQPPQVAPSPQMAPTASYNGFLDNTTESPQFAATAAIPPPELLSAVQRVSREKNIPVPILLGIAGAEHNFQNTRGADGHGQGYFQIDDRYFPPSPGFNPSDPYQGAIHAADQFGGDFNYFQNHPSTYGPVESAMRAYNAGRGGNLGGITPTQDYDRFTDYVAHYKKY